ncbi:hypothetical protein NMY22_g5644 [Coprinellus aureogranulatus]|nr:hypothetical protein NMY22_g5644 [Coprinellus aureogranulatus]
MASTTTSKPNLAILDDYQGVSLSLADWSAVKEKVLTIDVYRDTLHDEDAVVKRLEPYEIVCSMRERTKFTKGVLERLPNLKFIATTGNRNRGIDTPFAKTRGITVSGTGGGGNAVLEHIWALILSSVRQIVLEDTNIKSRNPQWQTTLPLGLHGRTLGLLGVGNLGKQVGQVAKLFGMKVVGWSPNLTKERAEEAGVEFAQTKEELLKQSDVLSIHLVHAPSTHHILKLPDLLLLPSHAYLINTSRGPLVEESALLQVLREGKIAGAGLDVFDIEPLPLDHELRTLKNVTLTPHSAYVSDTMYKVFYGETVENVLAYLEGKPIRVYE